MPNHVTNVLTLHGESDQIRAMLEAIQYDDLGIGSVDFNKIIPMPESLNIEAGSQTSTGLKAYQDFIEVYTLGGTIHQDDLENIPRKSEDAFLRQRSDIRPKEWKLGKAAWNNIRLYGVPTWYGWRNQHWGTKWNSYGYGEAEVNYMLNSRLDFEYMKGMLHSRAVLPDVRRAAYYYALIRYSYAAGTSTFGSQPHAMWNNFPLIESAAGRLQKVVIENKDCVKLIRQYRRQVTNGTAFWLCSYKASGRSECASDRVPENMVKEAFMRMSGKLADNREELLGDLIRQLEKLQNRTSGSGERIYQLNRQIADVNAQNLVVAQLHSSGILNNAEYAAQSGELNRKVSELRSERRRILMEDEDNEVIESLRALDEIMADYAPTEDFDEDLFGQIVESITVVSKNALRFCLAGGLALTERI